MSGDVMNFPDNWWKFVQQYQFADKEEVYTNGSMLIPSFRVRQMVEHYFGGKVGKTSHYAERTCKQEERGWGTEGDHARVWLTCGHDCMVPTVQDLPNYCPNCGSRVVE